MKHIVSVSLGSSTRDHQVRMELLGEEYLIERIGMDGDMTKMRETIAAWMPRPILLGLVLPGCSRLGVGPALRSASPL